MCVLLCQDLGRHNPVEKELFDKMWNANPHGCGVGYWRGSEPIILSTMQKDTAWKQYEHAVMEVLKNQDMIPSQPKRLMLHFRWATHGVKEKSNNHPFFAQAKEGLIVGHNGTTRHFGVEAPDGWSDTRTLAELWIPKEAPDILNDKEQQTATMFQLGGSRLALLTPWKSHLFNFPDQDKKEYIKYGFFSNFNFDPVYKPKPQQTGGVVGCGSKKCFKEFPDHNREDRARWNSGTHGGAYGRTYKYLSQNMVHRFMCYAIQTNMSFAGAMLNLVKLTDDFATHRQVIDFVEGFGEALTVISDWQQDALIREPKDICDHPHPERPEQLLTQWMRHNKLKGVEAKDGSVHLEEKEPDVMLSDQEKIELERALNQELEERNKEIKEDQTELSDEEQRVNNWIEEQRKRDKELFESAEKKVKDWTIDKDFPDFDPKVKAHEFPLLGYSPGDQLSQEDIRAFRD